MKFYLVGGAVRDELMGRDVKERDWVVVGGSVKEMQAQGFQQVGKEFPVFLHPKTRDEYALARVEKKVNPGYKGFVIEASADITLQQDLERRDLTINAMAYDIENKKLIDPFDGQTDLKNKVLKHVSSAFSEDPVRILRVGRFLARYAGLGFHVHPDTLALMKKMVAAGEVNALVAERVFKELERALSEPHPEKFFEVLYECGALSILFPGINIAGLSLITLKKAAKMSSKPVIRFAALMYQYPELKTEQLSTIREVCKRYRTPTYYHELAELVQKNYEKTLLFSQLNCKDLLDSFYQLDIFRRYDRFCDFLIVLEAIAEIEAYSFDQERLKQLADIVRNVDIQPLLKKQLSGDELGKAIYQLRLEVLNGK